MSGSKNQAFLRMSGFCCLIIPILSIECGFWFLEEEMRAASDRLIITTDDGSNGLQGFVTDRLREVL